MLWFRNQGIGGPDYTTLRIARARDGGLTLYVDMAGKESPDLVVLRGETIDKLIEYRKRTAGFTAPAYGGSL